MDSNIFKHPFVPFISVLLITTLVALLNIPVMYTLWQYSFDDGTYSHAYLIPVIVVYLFYAITKSEQVNFRKCLSKPALLLFLLSAYFLFITSTAQISLLYWLATILLVCSAINFVFNSNFKIIFSSLYFIFLIPLWGVLTIPLQSISVVAVNALMGLTTIPVYVEQQFVQIPSGTFEIAGGCSGLRYLLTSLAISSLYCFLYFRTIKNIAIFILVAIFGALLTNWLRIVGLIIIGHQTEMTSPLMEDHNMFGWYLYAPFMLLLFIFGGRLADKEGAININKVNTNTSPVNKPNWPLTTVLLCVLLFSSTSLQLSSTTTPKMRTIETTVQPMIYNFSHLQIITDNALITHLEYSFNGRNLESKPTFFANSFIPENWHVISANTNNENQELIVKNGDKTAKIIVSYQISGSKFGSSSKFKLERLKRAAIGINETKLHWQFQLQ